MEKENKSNLCRVCLGLGDYDIYNDVVVDNENILIDALLNEFTHLDLENLGLDLSVIPKCICALCFDKLIQCYQFLQQIRKADEYIMNVLTLPHSESEDYQLICKNKSLELEKDDNQMITKIENQELENNNHELENEQLEVEEYTVRIVDNEFNIIEKEPIINLSNSNINPTTMKVVEKKRKTNNKKSVTENIESNVKTKNDANYVNDNCENITGNKKFKISNIRNSIEDATTRFVITKFIPSETITTTHSNNYIENNDRDISNQVEQFSNDNSTVKIQNVIRTYDLAAVEIDPTDKRQFEKLMETNFEDDDNDDDDDDDDDDNSESNAVYACQYCPRAFSSSQFLKQHIRRTHTCQFCMKSFEKNSQLFDHIRTTHTEFNCPFCQKSYKSNCNLRYHMKKNHSFKLPAHTSLLAFSKKDESILSPNQNDLEV